MARIDESVGQTAGGLTPVDREALWSVALASDSLQPIVAIAALTSGFPPPVDIQKTFPVETAETHEQNLFSN